MKIIAWLAGIGTLVAAGAYMVISLNRWEWNRALFFGLIVLIAEVGLATGLILRRLSRLEHAQHQVIDPAVSEILRATRPPHPDRFAWLKEAAAGTGTNVFITFLVAGGVLMSGIAWIVDRVHAGRGGAPGPRAGQHLLPPRRPAGRRRDGPGPGRAGRGRRPDPQAAPPGRPRLMP